MIEEAATAFRVSIEYGDKDKNIKMNTFFVCTALAVLAMLNDDIRAHDEFAKVCFHGKPIS